MADEYKTFAHHWYGEVWNKGRAELIDGLLAPGVIGHGLLDEHGREVKSAESFKQFYQGFRAAFPDIQVTIEDTLADGDRLAVRCRVRATHSGAGFGLAATGRAVEFTGVCIMRVRDDKLVESWDHFDFVTLYQQLGATIQLPG